MRKRGYRSLGRKLGERMLESGGLVRPLSEIQASMSHIPTGWREVDMLFGGGLARVHDKERGDYNLMYLVGAEPGTGKSTFVQQLIGIAGQDHFDMVDTDANGDVIAKHRIPKQPLRCLYVSSEENEAMIKARANRLNASTDNVFVCETEYTEEVVKAVYDTAPDLLVVDSIQMLQAKNKVAASGVAGGSRQLDYIIRSFRELKYMGVSIIVIGHSTKTGHFAGTQKLKHVVDAVAWMETPGHDPSKRLFYFEKNRGGRVDIQVEWDMMANGLSNGEFMDRLPHSEH